MQPQSSTSFRLRPDVESAIGNVFVPLGILKDKSLTFNARLMLGILIAAPGEYKRAYFAEPESMASLLAVPPSAARRAFRELVSKGHLISCQAPTSPVVVKAEPKPVPAVLTGYIYVLRVGDAYKIGKAKDHANRIAQHSASNPEKVVEVMHERVRDFGHLEKHLHRHLRHKQIRAEWFRNLDEHDLAEIREALDAAKA